MLSSLQRNWLLCYLPRDVFIRKLTREKIVTIKILVTIVLQFHKENLTAQIYWIFSCCSHNGLGKLDLLQTKYEPLVPSYFKNALKCVFSKDIFYLSLTHSLKSTVALENPQPIRTDWSRGNPAWGGLLRRNTYKKNETKEFMFVRVYSI